MEIKIKGIAVQIDEQDLPLVQSHKWCILKHRYICYSEHTRTVKNGKITRKTKTFYLHREIIKTPKGMMTDHINGNRLDNRRCNLRTCSAAENSMNKGPMTNNTSGRTGVIYYANKAINNYRAFIFFDCKYIHLGYYPTFEGAVAARMKAEDQYFKNFKYIGTVAQASAAV